MSTVCEWAREREREGERDNIECVLVEVSDVGLWVEC